jgi:hypothetical protein
VVAKTPAAVVGVGTSAVDELNEIQTVRNTNSRVPVMVSHEAFFFF